MFDFAWSEFAVIAVVALLAIGPKDMPTAIRGVTGAIKKARRMASEFQGHVDEMVREANLGEVRDQISQLRNFDVTSALEKAVDPDHTLRDTFTDPTKSAAAPAMGSVAAEASAAGEVAELERPAETPVALASHPSAPAFIPPGIAAIAPVRPTPAAAPAFIPPSIGQPN